MTAEIEPTTLNERLLQIELRAAQEKLLVYQEQCGSPMQGVQQDAQQCALTCAQQCALPCAPPVIHVHSHTETVQSRTQTGGPQVKKTLARLEGIIQAQQKEITTLKAKLREMEDNLKEMHGGLSDQIDGLGCDITSIEEELDRHFSDLPSCRPKNDQENYEFHEFDLDFELAMEAEIAEEAELLALGYINL